MIELNKNKLIPGVDTSWGDITGDISKQSDLMSTLSSYATESWVSGKNYLTASSLKTINNQSIVGSGNINIEASVPDYYATKAWVSEQGYLTSETLPSDLATESWVSSQGYITTSALSGYATESWVSSQGYLTSVPDTFATKQWVSDQSYITSSALSGYATESWVSSQSYLTSTSLKTINSQSLVGEGDIEIGGLTPEQEAAIEPLEETSEGLLYTYEIPVKKVKFISCDSNIFNDYYQRLSDVDGDIYYNRYGQYLFKWNFDKLQFELVCQFTGNYDPLWKDNSGRLYNGVSKQFTDIDEGTTSDVSLNANYFYYENNHTNIVKGTYGIYLLCGTPQKFDEETQKFVNYSVTIPEYFPFDLSWFAIQGRWYEDHFVNISSGNMFEMVEYEDHLEFVQLQTPYFDTSINGSPIDMPSFHKCGDDYYYLRYDSHYKLVSGHWVENNITRDGYNNVYFENSGIDTDDYLIGYDYGGAEQGKIKLTNPSSNSYVQTYWATPSSVAVDLTSDQRIGGYKRFGSIEVGTIVSLQNITSSENLFIGTEKNLTVSANNINLSYNGIATLNGGNIATTDDCIVNRSYTDYGPYFTAVSNDYSSEYRDSYFTTHTGRLFKNDSGVWYELINGSTLSQVSFSQSFAGLNVKRAIGNTFLVDGNGSTYIWDDANTEFVDLNAQCPGSYWMSIWVCGSTLRYTNEYKLVENGGVWSWEQDSTTNYPAGGQSVVCGSDVYYFDEYSNVHTYSEANKTFTLLGSYWNAGNYNIFSYANEVFFQAGGKVYILNLDNVGTSKPIYEETSIPSSNLDTLFYGVCDNKLYTVQNYKLGYVYGMTESVPEVPASNGTYVLKAVRTSSGVTYSWVADEVPQAVQITNEILS